MKWLLYICGGILLISCESKNESTFPVSTYAASWIPDNQDSIEFKRLPTSAVASKDTFYLTYNGYSSGTFIMNETSLQQISQQAYSADSGFVLNYYLRGGLPRQDSLGRATKTDFLRLSSPFGVQSITIGNQEVTTDLFIADSLTLPNDRVFYNVLTDSVSYFFTQSNDIIMYKSNGAWYYKMN